MLTTAELCDELHIGRDLLDRWIASGWLNPATEGSVASYADIDIARARLILELSTDFEVNEQGIGIIIDLIDQIHGLRFALRHVLDIR
ncbi:chaperone modulator CbpM [Devosia sp. ZB163]|uniref:chaperone modulator CbpM n=1 Tax=Devosia sp. ZB163 TaxID=3025938 RepID=UPI0023615597|nr:chaperone modulator CbpM [Devosia sp. ZB163]MDC9822663.1 chaperone modulator CbpM [Devosia sp. ZB163]